MLYDDEKDKLYTEILFIVDGLRNDELIIVLNEDEEELISVLSQIVDVWRFLDKNQLIFLSKDESYLRDGFFDADRMLESIMEMDEKALLDGYRGLRVVGNANWTLSYLRVESFLEFEAKLNKLMPLTRCIALCLFDESKFNSDLLLKALQAHPKLIFGKEVKENLNYIPPDTFLKRIKGANMQSLQKLVDKKLKKEFGEMEEKFKMLFESSFEAVVILKGERIVSCNPKAMEILGIKNVRQLIGKKIYDILGDVKDEIKSRIRAAKAEPQFFDLSLSKNGESVELEISLTGVSDKLMMIARDVTEKKEMERKLKESEQRYRLLVESSIDAIITINSRTEILTWNRGAEEIYGYKAEEVIGEPLTILIPERFRDQFMQGFNLFKFAFKSANVIYPMGKNIEAVGLRKNREEFLAEVSYYVWRSGEELFFTSIVRDISERKRMEEKLRESERKYRELWEKAGDILFIIDLEGNFIEANRTARELFRYKREEVGKLSIRDVVDERYLPAIYQEIDKILNSKKFEVLNLELLCYTKDGKAIWIESRAKPIVNKGKVVAIQGIARDITERKRIEEKLKESEELFRTLAEKSLVGIYLIQDGVFKYVNPKLAELWGYSTDELIGKSPLKFIHPEDRDLVDKNLRLRIEGKLDAVNYTLRMIRRDGQVRTNEVFGSRIIYKGRPAVIGTLIDITERLELERARLKAFEQIERT